jgi:hypothetical protein
VSRLLEEKGRPKVIVASSSSLQFGFARSVLKKIMHSENNLVIFTDAETMPLHSLGYNLMRFNPVVSETEVSWVRQEPWPPGSERKKRLSKQRQKDYDQLEILERQLQEEAQMKELIQRQNQQVALDDRNFHQRRILGVKRKQALVFGQSGPFPSFSKVKSLDSRSRLTLYGFSELDHLLPFLIDEDIMDKVNAEQQQSLQTQSLQPQALTQEQVAQEVEDERPFELRGSFSKLQKEYAQRFFYQRVPFQSRVKCKVCYIPFEQRLDEEAFELLIQRSKPRHLVLLDATQRQLAKVEELAASLGHTQVH